VIRAFFPDNFGMMPFTIHDVRIESGEGTALSPARCFETTAHRRGAQEIPL
jgi:hypothetical protein